MATIIEKEIVRRKALIEGKAEKEQRIQELEEELETLKADVDKIDVETLEAEIAELETYLPKPEEAEPEEAESDEEVVSTVNPFLT